MNRPQNAVVDTAAFNMTCAFDTALVASQCFQFLTVVAVAVSVSWLGLDGGSQLHRFFCSFCSLLFVFLLLLLLLLLVWTSLLLFILLGTTLKID